MSCIFCKIVNREIPSRIVYEEKHSRLRYGHVESSYGGGKDRFQSLC